MRSSSRRLASATIYAPPGGFLHVLGRSYMGCVSGAGTDLVAELSANVDPTGPRPNRFQGWATWADCNRAGLGYFVSQNQTVSFVIYVAAGPHTVNLLGRKDSGTGDLRFADRTLVVQFVAQDSHGQITVPEPVVPTTTDWSAVRAVH